MTLIYTLNNKGRNEPIVITLYTMVEMNINNTYNKGRNEPI